MEHKKNLGDKRKGDFKQFIVTDEKVCDLVKLYYFDSNKRKAFRNAKKNRIVQESCHDLNMKQNLKNGIILK